MRKTWAFRSNDGSNKVSGRVKVFLEQRQHAMLKNIA